jgi:glycosyltransferase involved in cell wall biosynthesis
VASALDAVNGEAMRILIVISGLGFGGAERQVVLIARALAQRGHAVLIYTLNDHVPRREELAGAAVELVVDQKRWRLDPLLLRRLRHTIVDWRADIVHGFLFDGDLYVRLAAWGLDVAVLNSERSDSYTPNRLQRWGYRLTEGMCDAVVANSHAGAAFARRLHRLDDARVHVAWNGIDLAEVDARLARSARPARLIWPQPGVRLVCVVGAVKPAKDHRLALQVCAELAARDAAWRFVFVGDSLDEGQAYKREVLAERERLRLSPVSVFTGVRADALELMASCDVLLMTSRYEGFPNVVLEAMACGTPVASTAYSDVALILPFAWQVAEARDPGLLADIVERCHASRDRLRELQRLWVETHASIAHATDAMLRAYRAQLPRSTRMALAPGPNQR